MAEAYLNRIIQQISGGATISGTSVITGTYQETISANAPVYSILEPSTPDSGS